MHSFSTTIWVTFPSAGELHSGGLERCRVWFHKPEYVWIKDRWKDDDCTRNNPFGCDCGKEKCLCGQIDGVQKYGWIQFGRRPADEEYQSVSFGKVFGYESDFALALWKELCDFFGEENLRKWYDIEKKGEKTPDRFLIEYKLSGKAEKK